MGFGGWALTYLVAHLLGIAFADPERHVAAVWPASGVMLGALLSTPRRERPLMLALLAMVGLATNLAFDGSVAMSLGFFLANMAEGALCVWVVMRICRRDITFTRIDEVLALSAAAVFVNAATALLGAASPTIFGHAPFWPSYQTWWSANLLGIVLVTPLVVVWTRPSAARTVEPSRKIESLVFAAAWCVAAWIATHTISIGGPLALRPYMLVCLLPWAAIRLGLRVVTTSMIVLAAAVVSGARSGTIHHDFASGDFVDSIASAQIYVALAAITGLLLGASTSEARRARAAADTSAAHLTIALDAARMGTWEWAIANDQIHWSDQVKRIFGVTPESFSGTYDDFLALIHPDDRAHVSETIQGALERGKSEYTVEHRIIRPDGVVRWLEGRGRVDRDPGGTPVRMAGTVVDVTEQQQVVERLRQTQKMEAIGQLAGGVAHDFNNILSVILMQAELARKERALVQNGGPLLDEIVAAAERGAALTRQLLAFARRQVLQPKAVDLNRVVSDLGMMLGRLLGDEIRMRVELSPAPLVTRADAGMLGQVIVNLAVNARDAMQSGGDLTIATARVIVASANDDGIPPGTYVAIRVADAGIGIPPENMPRLFEPFFTTKVPGKGTGLGLATAFGILKLHHGFVRVTSAVGVGSTFEVLLPPSEDVLEPAAELSSPKPAADKNKETILLVEDDDGVRRTTRMLLEIHDYEIVEARNGPDALRVWEERGDQIDLLFTDLTMPDGLDGRQLALELRKRRPGLKVVLTSGYSVHVAGRTLDAGERFLMKPSTLPALLEAVDGALRS
jgi:PAS domain S-box-containing protein